MLNTVKDELAYLSGFGNEFESEVLPGALPQGCFSPQKVAYGLYAEKFSSTAFTAPRSHNRRTWFYRILPSVKQGKFSPVEQHKIVTAPDAAAQITPNPLRWDPLPEPADSVDFIQGWHTQATNGDAGAQMGMGIHLYAANASMDKRYFYNTDGELLIVPEQGEMLIFTECGKLRVSPGEIAVIPRGMTFKVDLLSEQIRGYVCENYGAPLELPERGPVGSDGYANDRDFKTPVAAYEEGVTEAELMCKFAGGLFSAPMEHSPLNVVAWVGTSVPYKYDLARFNTMNTVSYDHPDPSIFTVLTSQSDTPGVANIDFVIFPARWMVADNTFRPPWYHRNIMSEYMGLIHGTYDAKEAGFVPGGSSLHNCMSAHGPEAAVFEKASNAELCPVRYENTLAFMFESRYPIAPTAFAMQANLIQENYQACWQSIQPHFKK